MCMLYHRLFVILFHHSAPLYSSSMKDFISHFCCLPLLVLVIAGSKIPLYFSYITTFTGDTISSGAIPIVDRALDEINNSSEILQNYTLMYSSIMDSKCEPKLALDAFFYHFKTSDQPTNIASVCCGCSKATIPIASISHYWNIPQVSFTAMDSILNNRTNYKSFFRAVPSSTYLPFALAQLMVKLEWKKILLITQDQLPFTTVADSLRIIFEKEEWELHEIQFDPTLASSSFPYAKVVKKIATTNSKVIVYNSYGSFIGAMLCEAHYRGLKYPEYVHISTTTDQWWINYKGLNASCPHSLLYKAVNGSLSIVNKGIYLSRETNETQKMSKSFYKIYNGLLRLPQYSQYPRFPGVGLAYDTIWSLAMGLEEASKTVSSLMSTGAVASADHHFDECYGLPGEIVPLEQFDYNNQKMGCIFRQSMEKVEFSGVTGLFKYIDGHVNDMKYELYQYRFIRRNNSRSIVGRIEVNENHSISYGDFEFLSGENLSLLWGGSAAYDGSAIVSLIGINRAIVYIYSIMAVIGLLCAVICLVFNIVFRKQKVLKLTSPTLNYFVIVGSIFLYTDVILMVHSTVEDAFTMTVLCNASLWLFSIGYAICFAVILSKQWRIYYIFTNPTAKKKAIKDWVLLLIITFLISVHGLILFVGSFLPMSSLRAQLAVHKEKPHEFTADGYLLENYFYNCNSKSAFVSIIFSDVYIVCLQVVAMFMAFHTRKVKLKPLNDSKEIMAIIYVNSILLIILITTEFSEIHDYLNYYVIIRGIVLIIQASIFLGVTFIPKMWYVICDPDGKHLFTDDTKDSLKGIVAICRERLAAYIGKLRRNHGPSHASADGSNDISIPLPHQNNSNAAMRSKSFSTKTDKVVTVLQCKEATSNTLPRFNPKSHN